MQFFNQTPITTTEKFLNLHLPLFNKKAKIGRISEVHSGDSWIFIQNCFPGVLSKARQEIPGFVARSTSKAILFNRLCGHSRSS